MEMESILDGVSIGLTPHRSREFYNNSFGISSVDENKHLPMGGVVVNLEPTGTQSIILLYRRMHKYPRVGKFNRT